MDWLSENIGTLLVCVVLSVAVGAIVYKLIKDKKHGVSACGNNCAHCPMSGACHKK